MYETKFSIINILSDNQAKNVVSKLAYSIDDILSCNYDSNKKEIVIISSVQNEGHTKILKQLISEEQNKKDFKSRVLKSNQLNIGNYTKKESTPMNFEDFVKSNTFDLLMSKIDEIFINLSQTVNANQRKYSSLISREALERCDYVHTFPQNLYLVSEFPHNLETLSSIRESTRYENYTQLSEFLLAPAVCFHCYYELKGHIIKEPTVFTAKGNCYRHEARWKVNNYRRNEFSMRELIYLGSSVFVEDIRMELLNWSWDFFNTVGLKGKIESASDPFYFVEDQVKGQHQLLANMKYELIATLENGESFAIASFNNVGQSLCNTYEIKSENGQPLHSGCVAFGLDRWIYALVSEYGTEINLWPNSIKNILRI